MSTVTRRSALHYVAVGIALGAGLPAMGAAASAGPTILTVTGDLAGQPPEGVSFDAAAIDALPQHSVKAPTPWYKEAQTFTGPLLGDVLASAGARGKRLRMIALNDYGVEVPLDDVGKYRPVLARKINGMVLGIRDKGPLFLMYPFEDFPAIRNDIYYARCIWQLNRIQVI